MTTHDFDWIEIESDGPVVTVWMSRPPVNAVNQDMYRELVELFESPVAFGPQARVVVLAGRGKHFCAGNDLHEFQTLDADNGTSRMSQVRRAFFAIQDCPLPVVGAVHGVAFGTGLAIAASCDFVVAARDAKFGTPEVSVGVMGGARHLARLLPQPLVRWMYLSGEPASGTEMLQHGGVIEVTEADDVVAAARRRAEVIARHSPVVLACAKKSLNAIESMDLQAGYKYEQSLTVELSSTHDSAEARAASLEGRAPQYRGA